MLTKEKLRKALADQGDPRRALQGAGKAAEILRRVPQYREARQLFCDPAPILSQIRVNSLLDGKKLIMPSPGLRDGYYVLEPYEIPFRDLRYATTFKGIAKYGRRLSWEEEGALAIDLLVTAAQAVSASGVWLGDGLGFFDLSVAVFAGRGVLSAKTAICVVAGPGALIDDEIAAEPWDVKADLILTETGLLEVADKRSGWPPVLWDRLPKRRIRKITPLWKLYQEERKEHPETDLFLPESKDDEIVR